MKRGFTVVEVLVTLVIISIILGLGTVGLRSTLANGRDAERKADIETIARGLEQFYDGKVPGKKGSYPAYNEFWFDLHEQDKPYISYLPGTSISAFTTPSGNGNSGRFQMMCIFESPSGYWSTQPGCESPGNEDKIESVIQNDVYGYEAIESNGTFCYNSSYCTSYNLYWYSEVNQKVMTVKSKRS